MSGDERNCTGRSRCLPGTDGGDDPIVVLSAIESLAGDDTMAVVIVVVAAAAVVMTTCDSLPDKDLAAEGRSKC